MRLRVLSVLLVCMAASVRGAPAQELGLSRDDFRAFASSLPALPGNIMAVRFLMNVGRPKIPLAAILTFGEGSGWQIFLFRPTDTPKFALEWRSGRLADTFQGSSGGELKTFQLGYEEALVFEGCAAHVCSDVYSILLYVPSQRAAFVANYAWGKASYSFRLQSPENRRYKGILDQLAKERTTS